MTPFANTRSTLGVAWAPIPEPTDSAETAGQGEVVQVVHPLSSPTRDTSLGESTKQLGPPGTT